MSSSFADLVTAKSPALSRTEHRAARYFADNRHQVLVQSAMDLAQSISTSDATIIRIAKALGFDGLDGLRKAIADPGDQPAFGATFLANGTHSSAQAVSTATTIHASLSA